MSKLFLALHVLAAIIAIGPVTVAASMFPPAARRAAADPADARHQAVLRSLHRTCRVYALVGIAVPVFGFATAGLLGVTGDPWVVASIALTGAAAGVLALVVLPGQQNVLAGATVARLGVYTGVFNLLWAVVTVLMIVRPGSTTSV